MSQRLVIFLGVVLAAILAGLLWYQLVRQPESLTVTPSIAPTNEAFLPTPEPTTEAEVPVLPDSSNVASVTLPTDATATAQTTAPAVQPSAPTGPIGMGAAAALLTLTGASGSYLTIRRGRALSI